MQFSALPVLTYPKVRSAPVLENHTNCTGMTNFSKEALFKQRAAIVEPRRPMSPAKMRLMLQLHDIAASIFRTKAELGFYADAAGVIFGKSQPESFQTASASAMPASESTA